MNHPHNYNPDATWETHLVIPEVYKSPEQLLLEAFLRVEALLERVLGKPDVIKVSQDVSDLVEEAIAEYNETTAPKAKGKRK